MRRPASPTPLDEDDRWDASLYGEHLLIEDIDELEIDYYGTLEGRTDPDWHEEWNEPSTMPVLVRLRVSKDEVEWPPLVAALPVLSEDVAGQRTTVGGIPR